MRDGRDMAGPKSDTFYIGLQFSSSYFYNDRKEVQQ